MEKNNLELFIQKLNEEEEFVESIFRAQSVEEVQLIAKEEGIELTEKEVEDCGRLILSSIKETGESELSEDELDSVAGGLGDIHIENININISTPLIPGSGGFLDQLSGGNSSSNPSSNEKKDKSGSNTLFGRF